MSKKELNYKAKNIKTWDEALPLGNGSIGALVWGEKSELNFSLDKVDLWDERESEVFSSPDFNYKRMIELKEKGDFDELNRIFDQPYNEITPTKLPAGRIVLHFDDELDNIFELDMTTATAKVEHGDVKICAYTHAKSMVGVIEISGMSQSVEVVMPLYEDKSSQLYQLGYPPKKAIKGDDYFGYIQNTATDFSYAIICVCKKSAGKTTLVYNVVNNTLAKGDSFVTDAIEFLRSEMEKGLDYKSHLKWWTDYNNLSEITIPDEQLQRQYNIGNYLLGSTSRAGYFPMPLQGLWTADNGLLPPWKGDYHYDLNIEMSYWSYMKANRLESGKVLVDYLWSKIDKAREFARTFFDADGIVMPAVSTISGLPMGGWPAYSLNLVNQIFVAQAFDHYYRCTGDNEFLRTRAYEYLSLSAVAVIRWLKRDSSGHYVLPLSSSPEVYDNTPKCYQTPNTNNDLALLRYLFMTLVDYSKILKNGETEKWQSYLDSLEPIHVSKDKIIMMSPTELLPESHRHMGHMMCVFPLDIMDCDERENREILENSLHQLATLGSGMWVGFSFVWISCLYTRLGNGESAWYQLRQFAENFTLPNGFHCNGDYKRRGLTYFTYRPFTLEANMGFNTALQEMLLQDNGGVIKVFPAIPEHFLDASFRDLRANYGVLVSSELSAGAVKYIEFTTEKPATITLLCPFDDFIIERSNTKERVACVKGDKTIIELAKGVTRLIKA